jgi:predicted ATP-dependent serine protease
MATFNRKQVQPIPVIRLSSGFLELDWLYGETGNHWGIPMKAISLWAGESGTGKSRTAIAVCNKISSNGHRVLYFQNESDLGTFCQKIKYDSFRVSNSVSLFDMVEDIKVDRPIFVVIDSVNMITEFGSGSKKQIELIMNALREVVKVYGCHIILLGQLNQDGSIKGSTTLPHLVDIALNIEKDSLDGFFFIKVGMKHRFGRTGESFTTGWRHTNDGVESVTTIRIGDRKWKSSNSVYVAPKKKKRFSFFGNKK